MGFTGKDKLVGLQFGAYKSFKKGENQHTVDLDSNITLVIGRNNSGKSSLVDVIGTVFGMSQEKRPATITWDDEDERNKAPEDINLSFALWRCYAM